MPTSRPVQTSGKLGEILEYYPDVEDLKDEMEEWRDNMPESLQSSDKYNQVDEAANTLGNAVDELEEACEGIKHLLEELPKDAGEMSFLDLDIHYTEHKMYKGYLMPRWVRLANPCAALESAVRYIEDHTEHIAKDLASKDLSVDRTEDYTAELESYIKQVDDALGDLQGVEFPSMFG